MNNITIANNSFLLMNDTCIRYSLSLQECVTDIVSKELESLYDDAVRNFSRMSRTIGIKTDESPELNAQYIQMLNKTALRNQTLYFFKSEALLAHEKMMREHIILMYDVEKQYKEITHLRAIVTHGNDLLRHIRAEQKEMRSNIYDSDDKIQTLKMMKPVLYNAALYVIHTKEVAPTAKDYRLLQHDMLIADKLYEMQIKEKYAEKFTDMDTLIKEHYSKVEELQDIISRLLDDSEVMILTYHSMCKIHEELAAENMMLLQLKIEEQVMQMQLETVEKEYSDVYAFIVKSVNLQYTGILSRMYELLRYMEDLLFGTSIKTIEDATVHNTSSTEYEQVPPFLLFWGTNVVNDMQAEHIQDSVNDMQAKHLQDFVNDTQDEQLSDDVQNESLANSADNISYEESEFNDASSNIAMHNDL
ncbi:hypothetical protein Fsol_00081 [Candidatus Fokinia solitaria]|uniref:Uncharacterized protein n=1 Tax=Candidatus Fokinia solitaria TaxID=1802984 RepID=A0A2U8BRC4_9RICK|nr:hypothetical protein [Candidatus Fokinia solitaria]AWD32894.1 hypothetical protein Fsol_00081 [Candidatus Fokinia solitaria]